MDPHEQDAREPEPEEGEPAIEPGDGPVYEPVNEPVHDAGEVLPPPYAEEPSASAEARPQRRGRGPTVVACLVVMLALLGVLSMAFSVKLYFEHRAAVRTLAELAQSTALLSVRLDAPETVQKRLGWLQKALERGDWQQAQSAAEGLSRPDVMPEQRRSPLDQPIAGGPGGEVPDPMKVEDLPLEARTFFARNATAWEAFLGFVQAGLRLREAGVNVDDLRKLREEMVEAARLGQEERLSDLLTQARGVMERKTGGEVPTAFQEKMKQFAQAFDQARRGGRDVRKAAQLAGQAERAASRGNLGRASELIGQATVALKEAPRMRAPRPRRVPMPRMPQPRVGAELTFLRYLGSTLGSVMQLERVDLAEVWHKINTAAGAIREHNQDQIREILGEAMKTLDIVNQRRKAMSGNIQQAEQQILGPPPAQGERPARPSREELMARLQKQMDAALGDVRAMSDEEFAARRAEIAAGLVQMLLAPREPQGGPPQRQLSPEERVRAKMKMAAEPYAYL